MKAKIIGNTVGDFYEHYLEEGDIVEVTTQLYALDDPDLYDVTCIEGSKPGLPQVVWGSCLEVL